MAKQDEDWMSGFLKPTKKQFTQYLRGQQGQYGPMISTLLNQIRSSRPEQDFVVQAYDKLLKAQPSAESIREKYGSRMQNLASYITNLDTGVAGRGVSDVISGLGGALGVEGAGDIATAASTVSGIGEAGGSVINKALMQGAAGRFAGLETQALSDLSNRLQELTLGAGQARQSAKSQRQELSRMLAQTRGQRRSAMPNPFEIAGMVKSYQDMMKPSGGGSFLVNPTTITNPGNGDGLTFSFGTMSDRDAANLWYGGAAGGLPGAGGFSSPAANAAAMRLRRGY